MKIISIEPTPSPHSMKVNVNKRLSDGETLNFKRGEDITAAPNYIKQLFDIDGIINIYRVVDFITLARHPRTPWETILPAVQETLGTEEVDPAIGPLKNKEEADDAFGEVNVFVQMFRGIPMQVKLEDGAEESRFGLPELFTNAIMEASAASPNIIMERKWVEQSHVRYGLMDDIGNEVVEELKASYDEDRLSQLVKMAFEEQGESLVEEVPEALKITLATLDDPDWRIRYAALDRLDPTYEHIDILNKALDDERSSIRRLATMYLGLIEEPEVLPSLYKALKDPAANVRRTAGDCLSDLGFKEAMPEMIKTLEDDNRIVRWRAAMFLYEVGDDSAISALEATAEDPEFEVRLQINMALERIKGGKKAEGSIWHQMTQATSGENE